MSVYRMTYGSDTCTVELGQPEHPILVDGADIGRQCADGSCRTADCMRIAAEHCWGPVFETAEDAEAAGRDPYACCIWDDLEYQAETRQERQERLAIEMADAEEGGAL